MTPKAGSVLMGLLILGGMSCLTGCRSIEPSVPHSSSDSGVDGLSREHADRARSLALFSMGYNAELYRDVDTALSFYQQAAEKDPGN
ncbi:MAG: hypothetical protein KJ626_07645, partial [Verrucomicrobia bacterium]|nr:hypothetical protein [Verrucomicrobiota bacterium]